MTAGSGNTNLDSLPRIAGPLPKAGLLIVLMELVERAAFYGSITIFQNYIQFAPQSPAEFERAVTGDGALQPGGLGLGVEKATMLTSFYTFFCYGSPLFGAFVADQYLGKYRTIIAFSSIYMLGYLFLTASAIPVGTDGTDGTVQYGSHSFPLFIISLVILGLGSGGIKSVVSPMLGDQIPETDQIAEKEDGTLVVIDHEKTIGRLYNYFYWAINFGACLGTIACVGLERSSPDGFWKAFMFPACLFAIGITIFIAGRKYYVIIPPGGSILKAAYDCVTFAQKRYKMIVLGISYEQQQLTFGKVLKNIVMFVYSIVIFPFVWLIRAYYRAGTSCMKKEKQDKSSFKFLQYAKSLPYESPADSRKRYWSDEFPDELKQTLKACSIFGPMIIYWLCYNQMTNNLVSQASTMTRPSFLGNDIIPLIDPLLLIILIPIFDSFIYPMLHRHGIQFSYMRRITVGFLLGGAAMLWSAFVQKMIYNAPPYYDHPLVTAEGVEDSSTPNQISVFWQVPAYLLIACSEIFASIASLEYSYTHAPRSLKCVVSGLALLPSAASSLLSIFISPFANHDPLFTFLYAGIGIVSFITAGAFYSSFKHYDEEDLVMKTAKVANVSADEKTGNADEEVLLN